MLIHALRTGLIVALLVAVIGCAPPFGPVRLFSGSPHRFRALGAMMLLGFILGVLGALAVEG